MKFTITNPKSWLNAVTRQHKIGDNRKTALPILTTIKLDVTGSTVELTSTDLDTWGIQEYGEIRNDGADGAVCVPKLMLKDVATQMKGARSITVETEGNGVMFTDDRGTKLRASSMNAADFPKAPEIQGETFTLSLNGAAVEAFHLAAIAAGKDDARPLLTGVALDSYNGRLRWVSTDSYRLTVNEFGLPTPADFETWQKAQPKVRHHIKGDPEKRLPVVPAKPVVKLVPAYTGDNPVMLVDSKHAAFAGQDGIVMVRLIEGAYPNYRPLIRTDLPSKMSASVAEWKRGIALTKPIAGDHIPLRVTTAEVSGVMSMSATKQDVGTVSTDLEGSKSDFKNPIAFNLTYLGDGIRWAEKIGCDPVVMSVADPLKPGQINAADGSMYLLMPVRI